MTTTRRSLFTALLGALLTPFVEAKGSHGGSRGGGGGKRATGTGANRSAHSVRGYSKKNGTRVAPYRQSNGNDRTTDNWDTKGNINPDTGKAGSK
jgi:hypothetical protein